MFRNTVHSFNNENPTNVNVRFKAAVSIHLTPGIPQTVCKKAMKHTGRTRKPTQSLPTRRNFLHLHTKLVTSIKPE